MAVRKSVSLFDGEVVISKSGVYAFVHHYRHPANGREVVVVGMNHVGDEQYFIKVKKVLSRCDLVLFEDIRKESDADHNDEDEESKMREVVFGDNVDEAFMVSLQLYFAVASKSFSQAEREEEVFDAEYRQSHWFSGDMMLLTETQEKEYMENLGRALGVIAADRKRDVVEYVKKVINRMDQGDLNKFAIAEGFIFFYSDPMMTRIILQELAQPRDLYCFSEFDRLVQERNPRKVGIKFGAGHIANQRSLLEERGYTLQKSQKLCNISLKN